MTNPLIAARDAFLADHPETRITVTGREWGVIRAGDDGPALVLLPGTLGRADIFWRQIGALSPRARILSLSYPATGGVDEWAGDIAGMIAAEGFEDTTLLGSSLGGYVAQYAAGRHPGRIGRLVAANTLAATDGLAQAPPYRFDLAAMPVGDLRAGFSARLQDWLDPANPYRDLAGLLLAEVAGRIPEAELRARLQALKSAPRLPAQSLPPEAVFTVECDDDHLISPPMRAALNAALAPARRFRFRAASHFPYVTRPDDYTALLAEVTGLAPVGGHWPAGREAVI